jgi:dienelactone hydrolase
MRIESSDDLGTVVRHKIAFHSDSIESSVPGYLLIPKSATATQPAPAMLCLHQTTGEGSREPAGLAGNSRLHYALQLAERGYVTLAPDYPSFGEYAYDFDQDRSYASGTMKAIYDNIRAVELLQSLPEVDSKRIGCIGHSLGAHNAIFTAILEPRIRLVVSSCGFTQFHKDDVASWTGPNYMPRIATDYGNDAAHLPFEFSEIIACLAPRPFFVNAPTGDEDFDVTGVREALASAKPVYALFEKTAHLQAVFPKASHDFPKESSSAAYDFIDRHFAIVNDDQD